MFEKSGHDPTIHSAIFAGTILSQNLPKMLLIGEFGVIPENALQCVHHCAFRKLGEPLSFPSYTESGTGSRMPAIHLVCSVKNASYETLPRKKLNNASVHLFRLLIQRARGLPAVAPPVRKLQIVIVVEALLPVGIFVIDFHFAPKQRHKSSAEATDSLLRAVESLILRPWEPFPLLTLLDL